MKEIVAGVDIGGTNTIIGFVNSGGEILLRAGSPLPTMLLQMTLSPLLTPKLKEMREGVMISTPSA